MQMVFGNRGSDCGTGVCFSRDPSTGERGLCGEFLLNAQGEDVVAGIRRPRAARGDAALVPRGVRRARADGRAARAPLPRRPGHRVHRRARSAVPPADAVGEADRRGRGEGRGRDGRGRIAEPRGRDRAGSTPRSSITSSTPRSTRRRRTTSSPPASPPHRAPPRATPSSTRTPPRPGRRPATTSILVRWETSPDDIHGLVAANGVLTAHGGIASHAALVARGMGKPCVAGCAELTIDLDREWPRSVATSSPRAT